jgi:hypothetical protein
VLGRPAAREPRFAAGPFGVAAGPLILQGFSFLNYFGSKNCKSNIKTCRSPKIMKQVWLGYKNHDLAKGVIGARSSMMFLGCSKYFEMLKIIKHELVGIITINL